MDLLLNGKDKGQQFRNRKFKCTNQLKEFYDDKADKDKDDNLN